MNDKPLNAKQKKLIFNYTEMKRKIKWKQKGKNTYYFEKQIEVAEKLLKKLK